MSNAPAAGRRLLRRSLESVPPVVVRLAVVAAVLTLALVVGMVVALLMAAPSQERLLAALEAGTNTAMLALFVGSAWALIPALLMTASAALYCGMGLLFADAALRRQRVRASTALAVSARQVGHTVLAALIVVVTLPTVVLPIRWAFAVPVVVIQGRGWHEALAESWALTRGRSVRTGIILGLTFAVVIALAGALSLIGAASGSAWIAFGIQVAATLVLMPIPLVVMAALYLSAGGRASPDLEPREWRPAFTRVANSGGLVATVLSLALVVTLLTPGLPAVAADAPAEEPQSLSSDTDPESDSSTFEFVTLGASVATTVTVDFLYPLDWWFGQRDPANLTGVVTGGAPTGFVQLWGQTDGLSPETAEIGDPVPLAEDGTFAINLNTVLPRFAKVRVEYLGDDDHLGAVSGWEDVRIYKHDIWPGIEVVSPTDSLTVGDEMVFQVSVQQPPPPGLPAFEGEVDFYWIKPPIYQMTLMDTALLTNGVVQFSKVVTERVTRVLVSNGDRDPIYALDTGEQKILADAAPSTTTLSVQASVAPGGTVGAVAQVAGPPGVSPDGKVRFEATSNPLAGWNVIAEVAPDYTNSARIDFCVGDAAECQGASLKYLTDTSNFEVRATYVPHPNENERLLTGSVSDTHSVVVDPSASSSGECKVVLIDPRILGSDSAPSSVVAAAGDPRIRPVTNCIHDLGVPGHRAETLTLDARTAPGYEFVEWRHGDTVIGTQPQTLWSLPAGVDYAVIKALYQPVCIPYRISVNGNARIVSARGLGTGHPAFPSGTATGDCVRADGRAGVFNDTVLRVAVRGTVNPATGEADEFAGVTSSAPILRREQGSSITQVDVRITASATIEFLYRAQCHAVTPVATIVEHSEGEGEFSPLILTPSNCVNATSTAPSVEVIDGERIHRPGLVHTVPGFTRGTELELQVPELPDEHVLSAWLVNGEPAPELGSDPAARYTVGAEDEVTIGFETVRCHAVTTSVEEARGPDRRWTTGSRIEVTPAANCPDGSDRWTHGTTVTLTAVGAGILSSWTDAPYPGESRTTPRVELLGQLNSFDPDDRVAGTVNGAGVRTVTLEHGIDTTAHFYSDEACSTITTAGGLGLHEFRFPDDGCGPGRYWDEAKTRLNSSFAGSYTFYGEDCSVYRLTDEPWRLDRGEYECSSRFPLTTVRFEVLRDDTAEALADAQLRQVSPKGPSDWVSTLRTPLHCGPGFCTGLFKGDVTIQVEGCQGVDAQVELVVAGDESGTVYEPSDFGLAGFDWVTSDTPGCGDSLSWRTGTRAVLRADSPIVGIEFVDWNYVQNAVAVELFNEVEASDSRAPMAVHVVTDDTQPKLEAVLQYRVHCATVKLGTWVAIANLAPNCPSPSGELRYIIGSFLQVVANPVNHPDTRRFEGFTSGTLPGTAGRLSQDPHTFHGIANAHRWAGAESGLGQEGGFNTSIALVNSDPLVIEGRWQHPPSGFENFVERVLPQVGKFVVGLTSLAAGATVGLLCPPCATALAALSVSEYLVRLIPGGDILGDMLAMMNPLNLLECSTRWGFDTLEDPKLKGQEQLEDTIATMKLAKTVVVNRPDALERLNTKSSNVTKLRVFGASATFAKGLYTNRVDQFRIVEADAAELRNTEAYVDCVAQTYKAPGS